MIYLEVENEKVVYIDKNRSLENGGSGIFVNQIPDELEKKEGYYSELFYRNGLLIWEYKKNRNEPTVKKSPKLIPSEAQFFHDFIKIELPSIRKKINEMTDIDALKVKTLFPTWIQKIGSQIEAGERLYYDDKLYKVRQQHTVRKEFAPSVDTASLYEEINEKHKGTADDPITYNNNMRLESGKYYVQNDVVYKCTRDSEVAVYNDLKDLVGIYVESVK